MPECRGCHGTGLDTVLEMDPMPLAGYFPATLAEAEAAPRYPLTWARCRTCGLVNAYPAIPFADIYANYSYAASTVPALVRHHADLAAYLVKRAEGTPRLLEIGGNDGVLLKQLPETWNSTNVDPSDVAAEAWPGFGWHHIPAPFTSDLAADLGTFDIVTASNSLAHFDGIADALAGVALALRPGGLFVIEVHDLDATLATCQWDTIYHEHAVEWSETSLNAVIEPLGFRFREGFKLPLHGGLLRMAYTRTAGTPRRSWVPRRDFRQLQTAYTHRRKPTLPRGTVGYGAAARASVYLNQLPDLDLPYVIDGSPLRRGRYIAGRGIPIRGPEAMDDGPPAVLVTAWNHADDIERRHPDYRGQWITAWQS